MARFWKFVTRIRNVVARFSADIDQISKSRHDEFSGHDLNKSVSPNLIILHHHSVGRLGGHYPVLRRPIRALEYIKE